MKVTIKIQCSDNTLDAIEELRYCVEQAMTYIATSGRLKTRLFNHKGDTVGTVEAKMERQPQ